MVFYQIIIGFLNNFIKIQCGIPNILEFSELFLLYVRLVFKKGQYILITEYVQQCSRNRIKMNIESVLRNEPQIIISTSPQERHLGQDSDVIVTTKDKIYEKPDVNKSSQNTTSSPVEGNPPKKVCRICLEDEGSFIAPCICSGSMKYIHYKCLEQWLLKSIGNKMSYSEFKKSKCQVCGTRYNFKSIRDRFFDLKMIKKNYAQHGQSYLHFGIAILVVFLSMIALIIIIALINSDLPSGKILRQFFMQDSGDKSNLNIILTSTVFVLLCVIIIAATIFCFQFGFRVEVKILKIQNFATIRSKSYKNINKIYAL